VYVGEVDNAYQSAFWNFKSYTSPLLNIQFVQQSSVNDIHNEMNYRLSTNLFYWNVVSRVAE
jgi:hypothetical protein